MAFDIANLTPQNYTDAKTVVWNYSTSDTLANATGGGYFDNGSKAIRAGDVIRVTATDGKQVLLVTASDVVGGSVSVSPKANVSSFVN